MRSNIERENGLVYMAPDIHKQKEGWFFMTDSKLRNIGILAHVDAGKTTITENMLYNSGNIRSKGSVDEGTSQTDWLEVERKRGISVKATTTVLKWKDIDINLIDTPGHADFSAEVERTLRVMDGAILVISAAEGVEAQTEILWKALQNRGIPVIIFINKIDRMAADIKKVVTEIKSKLSQAVIPLQVVRGEGTDQPEIINVKKNESDDILVKTQIEEVIEFIADRDKEILKKYIKEDPISVDQIWNKLAKLTKKTEIFPLLYGSALKGIGINQLLDGVIKFLPAPQDNPDSPLSGVIFKVEHDDSMGKLCHVRLFGGKLKNRDVVYNFSQDEKEKITQIRKTFIQKHEDIGILKAGDIGSICGLSKAQTGDIIGNSELVPDISELAVPLLKVQVFPEQPAEYLHLVDILKELSDEDPLLEMEWVQNKQEIHIKTMGMIQLEVLESIIKERYDFNVNFGKPSVIYKETPSQSGIGHIRYTMPKPCWAVLKFKIEPKKRGTGVSYSSEVRPDVILPKYQKQVKDTIPEALKQGIHGWEVTDINITLVDGEHHVEHTHPPDFMVATPMGIMDGLDNTGTTLLEPVYNFEITVPEDIGGKVLNDIVEMRGEFDTPEISNDSFFIKGQVPVSTSMEYPVKLSSISGGKGIMKTEFSGYQSCPLEKGDKCPREGVNPLDKSNYILSVRNAT